MSKITAKLVAPWTGYSPAARPAIGDRMFDVATKPVLLLGDAVTAVLAVALGMLGTLPAVFMDIISENRQLVFGILAPMLIAAPVALFAGDLAIVVFIAAAAVGVLFSRLFR